jgi:hypothetical protein
MRNPRLRKSMASMFACVVLLCASGSGYGFVLCWGHDDHMHIETTFNGVDCGHVILSPVKTNNPQYLTKHSPLSTSPCYGCTDLPLSFPRYSASHNSFSAGVRNGKTATNMATLPIASFLLVPQTLHPNGQLMVSMTGHAVPNRIVSISLRI